MIDYENLNKLNETFEEEFKSFLNDFFKSGRYILGEQVKEFESEFCSFLNINECIGVANGLDAMLLSLKALDLDKGKEVLVPSNTYIATIIAVINAGLKPVLVEPDIKTYNIDTKILENHITQDTVAILPVHLYGLPCDMENICLLAKKYNLYVVEDCAQSHGATFQGKATGTFGDFGCFSFYPSKNLGALGDAGAIVTSDHSLAQKSYSLRNYGSEKKYHNKYIGHNSRLDEIQAGFLRIKLRYLEMINQHKKDLAEVYYNNLNNNIIKPHTEEGFDSVFHIFPVRHEDRDGLKKYLFNKGINTEIHYPIAPHNQKAFDGFFNPKDFPISQLIHDTILSLPISLIHSKEEVLEICKIINNYTK